MKFAYDQSYAPPAPNAEIFLAPLRQSFSVGPLSAFIDTGADATIIPISYIEPLSLQVDDRKFVRSPWGERRLFNVYFLDVGIGDIRLPFIEIVADTESEEIILGRSVLNKLRLKLDGPALGAEISP